MEEAGLESKLLGTHAYKMPTKVVGLNDQIPQICCVLRSHQA